MVSSFSVVLTTTQLFSQWGETFNHVFGRTTNPYNRYLTPGGSSGGEGALVAMKGSPLGVGTDIDGSLRIPSAFCGLYTLRPSYERLPYYGAVNALEGQESISSVLGPMANTLSGEPYAPGYIH
jgi:amidase